MPIYPNFYQTLTTACPIVELRGYAAACGLKGHLYAYLDFNGPTGTARDGLAEGMLALAIEKKQLAPGQPIIEAASGPFATALTLASLTAGHPIVLVMPEDAPALRDAYSHLCAAGCTIAVNLIVGKQHCCARCQKKQQKHYQQNSACTALFAGCVCIVVCHTHLPFFSFPASDADSFRSRQKALRQSESCRIPAGYPRPETAAGQRLP